MSITLPEGITLPQENPLASLLGGLGTGIGEGAKAQMDFQKQLQLEEQKQEMKMQKMQKLMKLLNLGGQDQQGQLPGQPISQPLGEGSQQGEFGDQQQTGLPHSEEQIMGAALLGEHDLASSLQHANDMAVQKQKAAIKQKEFGHTATKDFRDEIERSMKTMPTQELSLGTMKESILEGDLGPTSADYWTNVLADYTGIESFRDLKSLKGSELLTAQKAMYGDLRELFPGQIRTAELSLYGQFLPQLGKSKAANLGIWNIANAMKDMKKIRANAYEKIIDQNGGYTPLDISSQVNKAVSKDMQAIAQRTREASKDLYYLMKREQKGTLFKKSKINTIKIYDPNDPENIYRVSSDNAFKAIAEGWRIDR